MTENENIKEDRQNIAENENIKEDRQNIAENENIKEDKNVFNTWIENYTTISEVWKDSYFKIYKPWLESTEKLFEKAVDLSKNTSSEKHNEFYDLWIKTYQETYGKLFDIRASKNIFDTFVQNTDIYVNFFENTPTFRPFKSFLEPVKNATKAFVKVSEILARPYLVTTDPKDLT